MQILQEFLNKTDDFIVLENIKRINEKKKKCAIEAFIKAYII